MGLFSHETQEPLAPVHIKPVVIRTSNVAKELMQTAANAKVSVHTLDFNLLDTQTFSKTGLEGGQEEWVELSSDEVVSLGNEEFLNPKFELKQVYEIEIFTASEPSILDSIHMSIGGNATLCKIYLTIKPGSVLTYYEDFQKDFLQLVNKKKLRANLMIGLFDSMMQDNLRELFAKTRIQETYNIDAQERYLISEGIEPVDTINDALILHYEKKRQNQDEYGRIDYAKRGYVISAVENELLIEYIKPKKGESGRNCRGEFIVPKEPLVKNEPTFGVGENISVGDTADSIEYRAKAGGYVTFEGGMYDIRTEMDVTEISFKTTGSIDTQLDADVSINVKEKDVLKDAIGMGMDVTVNVINIDGNIGPNAKVTAHKATVEGQVHQSAVIEAEDLSINILKGTARGKKVHITRLEHGIVEADSVTITQAIGGKVCAREITVEMLGSHVKLTASHKIEIMKLQGAENQLVIDPLINESEEEIASQGKKMEQAKIAIRAVHKEVDALEQTWRENAQVMEDLKRKLAHYKQNGIKLPTMLVQKYQQFQQLKDKIEAMRGELKQKEDHYAYLSEKHTALQNSITDARIINHDRWRNHNEVVFKLIDPRIDVMHIPSHNSEEKILGLREDENGEFSIKVMTQ